MVGFFAFSFQDSDFPLAAYNGDIKAMQEMMDAKINPNARDSFGGTAMHASMFQKNLEVVKMLIAYGCDVNAVGIKNGYTPLHDGVWASNLEAIKLLIKAGANPKIKSKDGLTPYQKASKEGKSEIASYLKQFE